LREEILDKIEKKLDELATTAFDGEMNYAEIWTMIQTHADEETLEGIYSVFCEELQRRTKL